jgi:uncharacterized cupredoxin-like copper-binding protein
VSGAPWATRRRAAAVVAAAVLVPVLAGFTAEAVAARRPPPLGPGLVTVELTMHHSRFSATEVDVWAGTVVRFVLTNADPIDHEFVVGPDSVHERHERGTEHRHGPVPGEVSVGLGQTGLTVYRFDEPGEVRFACHLNGHAAYGMTGRVTVHPPPGV